MLSNLRQARRAAEAARTRFVTAHTVDGARREIGESWLRSGEVVGCERTEAPMADGAPAAAAWRASPFREPVEGLRDELDAVAEDGFIVAITDARGMILHTRGGHWMRERAERVNFAPGARWDEWSMGTNALGLALATAHPSTVFSAEHFSAGAHDWVCYAAPILDAAGRPLGVVDLSTTWDRAQPLALTTATTIARLIGTHLPLSAEPATAGTLELFILGASSARLGGVPVRLSPRQVEILAILALHRDGLSLDALHAALYVSLAEATLGTCRAEISHLRRRLPGVVKSRPYRLSTATVVDAVEVLRLLRAGRIAEAAGWYRGPLLPGSEAPLLVEYRHLLTAALRTAALSSRDPDALLRLGEVESHDREVNLASLAVLGPDDPRAALVAGRLRSLS